MDRILGAVDVEALTTQVIAYIPNVVGALLVLILFWGLFKVGKRALEAALQRADVSDQATRLLSRLLKYVVGVIAFLTAADQLGINVAALIAGLGVAGLALSFAAQDTVANLISGIAIIIDRPFTEGDWIAVGGMHASVGDIRLRTTVLTTFDNETVVVPNKDLAQERVINYTLTPRARARVSIGIAYKEDMQQAREILLNTIAGDDRILKEPAPAVVVTGLGDSSVNLELRFWTEDPLLKYSLIWEYTEKCKRAFDESSVEIPFPHMQLFLEKSEGLELLSRK